MKEKIMRGQYDTSDPTWRSGNGYTVAGEADEERGEERSGKEGKEKAAPKEAGRRAKQ